MIEAANDNQPTTALGEQLAALMAYRNRPPEEPEPLQSNWSTTPSTVIADPEEIVDYGFERHLRMTPSVQEIMRQVAAGPVARGAVPLDDKGEPESKQGPIVGIGKLKFSDGKQTEKAHMRGPDGDTIQYDRIMPVGAMLNTREKAEGPAGGKGYNDADLHNSDVFYASMLGTEMPRFIKRGDRRNGPSMSAEQSRENLAKAIANTPVLPPVKVFPKGLPCGSDRVADSFVSFKKTSSGQAGSIAWEDIGQTIENAKVWKNLRKALKSDDVAVLDAAMQAQTYGDLDFTNAATHRQTAVRRGKRFLVAANDNLAAAIKKHAS